MAARQSTLLNMLITLGVITAIAGIALGYVQQWTKDPIAEAQLQKQLNAIKAVVPAYDNNPVEEQVKIAVDGDSLEVYPATYQGQWVGAAIKAKSSKGYSGVIWLMVGFDARGLVHQVVVIEHKETPGLGSKMNDEKFKSQYLEKDPGATDLRVKKDGGLVDAISGATISSRAFSEAVQQAYRAFQQLNYGHAKQ
jgi:electron transport complex protein RnfG